MNWKNWLRWQKVVGVLAIVGGLAAFSTMVAGYVSGSITYLTAAASIVAGVMLLK